MKKILLLVIVSLCSYDAFSQDTTGRGFLTIIVGSRLYSNSKETPPIPYVVANIRFPHLELNPKHPRTSALFTVRQGFDHPAQHTTTLSMYGGVHFGDFGKEKFYVTGQTGILWTFDGGPDGNRDWALQRVTIGGNYCIKKKIRGSYFSEEQFVFTLNYDATHPVMHAKQSNFLNTYSEVNLNVTKFLSFGYGAGFYQETSKKVSVQRGVANAMSLQSNNPRGPLITITFMKDLMLKLQITNNTEQKGMVSLRYTLSK